MNNCHFYEFYSLYNIFEVLNNSLLMGACLQKKQGAYTGQNCIKIIQIVPDDSLETERGEILHAHT